MTLECLNCGDDFEGKPALPGYYVAETITDAYQKIEAGVQKIYIALCPKCRDLMTPKKAVSQ